MTGKIKKIISIENGDNYVADIEDIENRIVQNSSNLESAKQELSNKCNEALSQAKAYTDQEKAKYLPLTGGLVKNSYIDTADNSGLFRLEKENGSMLFLFDVDSIGYMGGAILRTVDKDSHYKDLQIKNNGSFTWDGLNVVRSVNGALADANGNVSISDVEEIGYGYIRLKSGLQICWGSTPGKINSTPVDFDSIEINLSKAFKNTGYTVICTDTGDACFVFGVHVSDATRFTVYVKHWGGVTSWGAYYIAIGM